MLLTAEQVGERQWRSWLEEWNKEVPVPKAAIMKGSWEEFISASIASETFDYDFGVPQFMRGYMVNGVLAGVVTVRTRLTPKLEIRGGHIGYGLRPSMRSQGLALPMFKASQRLAYDLGLVEAIVTCAPENARSSKVIQKGGGVLIKTHPNSLVYRVELTGST